MNVLNLNQNLFNVSFTFLKIYLFQIENYLVAYFLLLLSWLFVFISQWLVDSHILCRHFI